MFKLINLFVNRSSSFFLVVVFPLIIIVLIIICVVCFFNRHRVLVALTQLILRRGFGIVLFIDFFDDSCDLFAAWWFIVFAWARWSNQIFLAFNWLSDFLSFIGKFVHCWFNFNLLFLAAFHFSLDLLSKRFVCPLSCTYYSAWLLRHWAWFLILFTF